MTKSFRTMLVASTIMVAAPAQAAGFIFDTTTAGQAVGSGNGNALIYTGTDGQRSITMKATGWTRGFDGAFTAGEIVPFIGNGLGIVQQGEGGGGNYHQIDNVNGWEFAILQFSEAVSMQSAALNTFRLWDRNYVDSDAYVAWNRSNLSLGDTLTGAQARNLFDTRLGGFNSDSVNNFGNLQTYARSPSDASNVWIIGGSYNGPDWRNDAFKLAQVNVTAVPEPGTWAMMMIGFGVIGGSMRYRRRTKVTFA